MNASHSHPGQPESATPPASEAPKEPGSPPVAVLVAIAATAAVVLGLAGGFVAGRLTAGGPAGGEAGAAATIWTCSMHPQIQQPNPGKCPICAMDLIPLDSAGAAGPRELALSPEAMQLARIETSEIVRRLPEAEVRLFGKVAFDETRLRSLAARFPARIDRLFVDYTGITVREGDHLAEVYGPELLTAQTELLTARRFDNAEAIAAARDKLRLWGLSDARIAAIEASGSTSDRLVIDAPVGGVVTHKNIREGDYVETGTQLFQIADLGHVWLSLDAYENDLAWLRFGQHVTFTVAGVPGREFEGRIAFISPELDPGTRTVPVRVNVDNTDGALKPGMFATAVVKAQVAGTGRVVDPSLAGKWISPMHPEIVKDHPGTCDICGMDLVPAEQLGYTMPGSDAAAPPLLVPASAVLQTGRRAVVYVQVPDRETPTFEGVEILLGPRAGDHYLVAAGLEEGQRVVTHGAFKIDSALQIEAKPSMMSIEGEAASPWKESPLAADRVGPAVEAYLAVQVALADDDLEAARVAATALSALPGVVDALPVHEAAGAVGSAADITAARLAFEPLAAAFIELASSRPDDLASPLSQVHCPMAFDFRGADWLQAGGDLPIRNPYFGAEMLECGHIERRFPSGDTAPPTDDHESH